MHHISGHRINAAIHGLHIHVYVCRFLGVYKSYPILFSVSIFDDLLMICTILVETNLMQLFMDYIILYGYVCRFLGVQKINHIPSSTSSFHG